jgi:histidinol-phosphate phosphatase family protein
VSFATAGITDYIAGIRTVLDDLPLPAIQEIVGLLHYARMHGWQVFVLGNGGSAATASHFACDLGKGTIMSQAPRVRALALTDNMPMASAWANDAGYENMFGQQLANLVRPGDVVIAISASGNSANVINAVQTARDMGAITVGMTGFDGGRLDRLVDISLVVRSSNMQHIEDAHLVIEHMICSTLLQTPCDRRGKPRGLPSFLWKGLLLNGRRPAVFLDRDGVINENHTDYVRSWDEFSFLPQSVEALGLLAQTPADVVVVTNQSAINRGMIPMSTAHQINQQMVDQVRRSGGRIDDVQLCPHRPDEGCDCRKPKPGLFLQAARSRSIDLASSYMIGDSLDDVAAGKAAGCHCVLVMTGRGSSQLADPDFADPADFYLAPNLLAAVRSILRQEGYYPGHRPLSA